MESPTADHEAPMDGTAGGAAPRGDSAIRHRPSTLSPLERIVTALTFAACLALLVTAATLTPAARGMGTHTQLGLEPCGFEAYVGLPCATCGMTTAFAHAAHGQLVAALIVQPAGAALALLTAAAALVTGYALLRGVCLTPLGRWLWRPVTIWGLTGLILAGWAFTVLRAMI